MRLNPDPGQGLDDCIVKVSLGFIRLGLFRLRNVMMCSVRSG